MNQPNEHFVLSTKDISKSYGNKKVLKHIDINVEPGACVGLIGQNGAGKSTLFKCIAGLTSFDEGSIEICGHSISREFEAAISNLGGLINSPGLYQTLSGFQNMEAFAILRNVPKSRWQANIELLGMSDFIAQISEDCL